MKDPSRSRISGRRVNVVRDACLKGGHEQRIRRVELHECLVREEKYSGAFNYRNLCDKFVFTLAAKTCLSMP